MKVRFWWRSARHREPADDDWADLGPAARIEDGPWQGRTIRLTERLNRECVARRSVLW